MSKELPPRPAVNENLFAQAVSASREAAKPFYEREIAEIITRIARDQPNLLNFVIFPNAAGAALAAFKMIVGATHRLKKPLLTTWEKHMVLTTLKEPVVFVTLASFIVLSMPDVRDEVFWNGKGRIIDTKLEQNMKTLRKLAANPSGTNLPPSDYFIEIITTPYFDRLKHLLEGTAEQRH